MPTGTDHRVRRQQAIREILQQQPVARQAQLVAMLRERGIDATQSSVSRDLKQLGIAKLDSGYAEPEPDETPPEQSLAQLEDFLRGCDTAGSHLTVIRTAVGAAQRVAVCLDRSGWPEIVGTLSGDDTILVATRNGHEQRGLLARLRQHLPR